MLALDGDDRAARIAAMVPVVARQRADNEHPEDWTNHQSWQDYTATMRSIEAWTDGPEWNRVVVARPRIAPTGDYWTHMAADILDVATDRVDNEAGDHYTFEHGEIEPAVGGGHEARLTWRHKPNLHRLHHRGWCAVNYPMVTFVFEGRRFFLNRTDQHMPVYVANRHSFRHGTGGACYSLYLLSLARLLRVDTETVRRISEVLVPDRCGFYHERNPAIRILSETEQWAVEAGRWYDIDGRLACGDCKAHAGEDCRRDDCGERTVLL